MATATAIAATMLSRYGSPNSTTAAAAAVMADSARRRVVTIEQATARVNHRFTVAALKSAGMELERNVLARAVQWHLEDRVIVFGNKTVVFR